MPYFLYGGVVDDRGILEDVIAAFNILRAEGPEIKLVLAGDNILGPDAITYKNGRKAL